MGERQCRRTTTAETKAADALSAEVDTARFVMQQELQHRLFELRPSNAHLVQCYMSKQMDAKEWMVDWHFTLAKTLYLQWLRQANTLLKLPMRESSPRKEKAQKLNSGKKLFRGASSAPASGEGGDDSAVAAHTPSDGFDPVTDEVERWARLPRPEHYEAFYDEDGQLVNEFEMMWALRERFPLHFIVFKQVASHLSHEANVEQVFSRAGNLAEVHMDPDLFLKPW